MKRRLLALSLILIVALAAVGANQFTENILDRELPPLLSDALGLPVFLKPTSVNLLTLGASSPELIMGDRNNPTIVAQQVRVRLSWKSLLRGEIRFVYAQATDLMVSVFRWPSNDNPWPEDYQFLDQWIPEAMQVDSARTCEPTTVPTRLRMRAGPDCPAAAPVRVGWNNGKREK